MKLVEKLSDIAGILGISMEGRLDELQSFIHDMLEEGKSDAKVGKRRRSLEPEENQISWPFPLIMRRRLLIKRMV